MVVGGGSAGCTLAGRLAAAGTCRVLLLEAGPVGWMPEILDVTSLAACVPGHPANWAHPVELRTGSATNVPRGRVLGGSGAVNGAVWMRATSADGWGLPGLDLGRHAGALRPVRGGRRSRRSAGPRR